MDPIATLNHFRRISRAKDLDYWPRIRGFEYGGSFLAAAGG